MRQVNIKGYFPVADFVDRPFKIEQSNLQINQRIQRHFKRLSNFI